MDIFLCVYKPCACFSVSHLSTSWVYSSFGLLILRKKKAMSLYILICSLFFINSAPTPSRTWHVVDFSVCIFFFCGFWFESFFKMIMCMYSVRERAHAIAFTCEGACTHHSIHVRERAHTIAFTWKPENNFTKLLLFFHFYLCPGMALRLAAILPAGFKLFWGRPFCPKLRAAKLIIHICLSTGEASFSVLNPWSAQN